MLGYEKTGNEIERRIKALVPNHPELLNFKSASDLRSVGLEVDDLRPSYFQVAAAFNAVKAAYNKSLHANTNPGAESTAPGQQS